MNKEKDEKALKAFWCMLESAESKDRRLSHISNEIKIWANDNEGKGVIASIQYKAYRKEVIKRKFLGIPIKKEYLIESFIYGEVVNTIDSNYFHFGFSGDKVEPIRKRIEQEVEQINKKEKEKRNKSLESLLC